MGRTDRRTDGRTGRTGVTLNALPLFFEYGGGIKMLTLVWTDARTESRMNGWNHGRTDKRTERRKLYTPRHTLYAVDINSGQEWTLPAHLGQLKTGQDGKGLL